MEESDKILQVAVDETVKDDMFEPTAKPGQLTSEQLRWVRIGWESKSIVDPVQVRKVKE
ncbi:hypothetical protein KIN20_004143 [Parelaphostrongylus tenuis]|uniref:Uncharacterized protein n=1 Tax=Parelaphostrongylus tenuis TaxID=148309 RepID=A0AAD5MGT1_PARTN|nr:hypothetical protein KIN20_004143 [Parelaphostrongylus tenuis]